MLGLKAAIDDGRPSGYRWTTMAKSRAEVVRRARKIKLLLCDVDGVLTDGKIYLLSEAGGRARELKAFDSQDGAGLRLLQFGGVRTGIITGRASAAVTHRARELKMDFTEQNVFDKLPAYRRILKKARVKGEEVCFVGDDVTDLPVLSRAGLAVAVPNGTVEVRRAAHYVTKARGGEGAVREVAELILKAQRKYDDLLERFRR